jgi:signal recognition particle subunit SRP54
MFDSLSGRLGEVFEKLTRRGSLSPADVEAALREVRVALLEADVALPVVRQFIDEVKDKAVGQEVLRGVNPGQQVVKVVHDHLVAMLGEAAEEINLRAAPPVPILMVGLQGSGKTTTSGKLALRLKDRERKKVLLASLDVRRPAAQEQLATIGAQIGVETLEIVPFQTPLDIAKRALDRGRKEGFDVVILDSAGRLAIDEELMAEIAAVRDAAQPAETLLVADAMTGQDAVNTAQSFNERVGLTGIVLTRIDGDARGGAALSMRAVTGKPIKLLGTGEKLDALEAFHPERIAGRILGMGDVVSLVEKAAETMEVEQAEKLRKKFRKGEFDLDDMWSQLRQLKKMGGMGSLMNMLPGVAKAKKAMAAANFDDKAMARQEAILSSMTPYERANPKVIHASRKKRIAAGSGTAVQDINKLLKQYQEMSKMMKRMKKMSDKGQMPPGMEDMAGLEGGVPSEEELKQLMEMQNRPGGLPPGLFKK